MENESVLFEVGEPVIMVPPPQLPPEPVRPEEPDRTIPFEFEPPLAGATFSPCGRYRYVLWRKFKNEGKRICWIMLNPSTADAENDDPTIRRVIPFSKREGAAEVFVLNLFAFRSTDPKKLLDEFDPYGPENIAKIWDVFVTCDLCVAAWGCGGSMQRAGRKMMMYLNEMNDQRVPTSRIPIMCLGVTKNGHPRHPLYVSSKASLISFEYSSTKDDGCEF